MPRIWIWPLTSLKVRQKVWDCKSKVNREKIMAKHGKKYRAAAQKVDPDKKYEFEGGHWTC